MVHQDPLIPSVPRLPPTLKTILFTLGITGTLGTILYQWIPGGRWLFQVLTCHPGALLHGQVWRLFTAGFLTHPYFPYPLLFTLLGLYLFCPTLEKKWGGRRLVCFLLFSVSFGYLLSMGWGMMNDALFIRRRGGALLLMKSASFIISEILLSREGITLYYTFQETRKGLSYRE